MSSNVDKRIDHLIICLNDANTSGKKGDSLKMRNISNFYERCRNGRYGEINEKDLIKKLIKKKYKIKNDRDKSIFSILPYIFSDRDESLKPDKINEPIYYAIGNMPLDEDLKKCNIFVYEKEFLNKGGF